MTPMIAFGLTQLFRGARRGQALVAGFGAAVLLLGIARKKAKEDAEMLFDKELIAGDGLTFRFVRGSDD